MFYMSVCPFVALSKAIRMPKIRTFICLVVINKAFIFNLLCVLISKLDLPREGAFHLRSSPVTLSEVFSPFRVLYLFVRLSLCRRQYMPKIRALFCLVVIKKRSFLTSCVF